MLSHRHWGNVMNRTIQVAVVVLAALACLFAPLSAQAGPVISINFASEQGPSKLNPGDSAGVVPATHWNNVINTGGTAPVFESDGTTSGGTVTWIGPQFDANTGGTPTTPDENLLYGYIDASTTGSNGKLTVTVSGLPATISPFYDVYVYTAGTVSSGAAGDYTIGGTTILATQGSNTTPYVLAGNGTAGNYIKFTGVSGSSFSLVAGASIYDSPVNGMQIVQVPKVTWTGASSNVWSTGVIAAPKNWLGTNSAAADYPQGAGVFFDDTATGTTSVNISAADVTPDVVVFNNSTKNYTLEGSFGIAGMTALSKTGSGSLTIQNTNKFTGPVTFGGGTIAVAAVANGGANSPLGAGTSLIFNSSALQYTGVDAAPAPIAA